MPIDSPKSKLRTQCRAQRQALGEETRQRASLQICEHLAAWPVLWQATTIAFYWPMKGEVDLRPLTREFPAKHWLLPRIAPQGERRMDFHRYDPARLVVHPFGMAEPAADLPVVAAPEIELVLVPGLAYDRQGWRLGYGGGYYDRFLSRFNGISAGVTYQALVLDTVPHGEHDVAVGWIVTEKGIFWAANNAHQGRRLPTENNPA